MIKRQDKVKDYPHIVVSFIKMPFPENCATKMKNNNTASKKE